MRTVFASFLSSLIRTGHLEIQTADRVVRVFGDRTGPRVGVRIKDRAAELELMFNPALALGELYMDGRLEVAHGDLYDLLALGAKNLRGAGGPLWIKMVEEARVALRRLHRRNDRRRARQNVAHHYDLDARLYDLFLDPDRQYSCGYFERRGDTLEAAQLAKKRHVAAKLLVGEGHSVLDIGCGFGGMALYLAQMTGARTTGVTLSKEQFSIAEERAREAGLADRVAFRLQDYRDATETYDRIVSIGMFEHVGLANFDEFFSNVGRLLKDDGVMLLHAIGRSETPAATNPWIEKYIFPGGYIAALSEVFAAIERAGLFVTDTEILRLHYAETLKLWRERFNARRDEARALYDERFCRMWEFYLAGSETAFRIDGHMVFQIQLAKRQDVAPLTRDYIVEAEARLRQRERGKPAWREAGE
jgi:cyclopropane-fatty-acyl-phospholipid synthase